MRIRLTFLGAARCVTGSRFLVEANGQSILVDCGLYQEREFLYRNWEAFPFPPARIGTVLLTHAHLDHSGFLPRLVREGFAGRVVCTAATADISQIILRDSGKIQEQDAAYKKKRHQREGRRGPHPEVPLYTIEDAEATAPLFTPVDYGEEYPVGNGIVASFHDAGHVLGSAMVKLTVRQGDGERTILFSGDVGRWGKPILKDPSVFRRADYVLVESTYGLRRIEHQENLAGELAEIVRSTAERGGNIVIPAFALERSQELLYYLNLVLARKEVPRLPVYVDSPMAVNITDVFERHPYLFDAEMLRLMHEKRSPFDFPGLQLVRTVEESQAINRLRGSAIIMAGSGMCTGGRIKFHLVTNITRPESTILFVGYQARGTLGREIVNGARSVRILGQHYPVRARIAELPGFSGHADRDGLLRWLGYLEQPPRHVFVVHGEEESATGFSRRLGEWPGWTASAPEYGTGVWLD